VKLHKSDGFFCFVHLDFSGGEDLAAGDESFGFAIVAHVLNPESKLFSIR